jgi:hypothetical protein
MLILHLHKATRFRPGRTVKHDIHKHNSFSQTS